MYFSYSLIINTTTSPLGEKSFDSSSASALSLQFILTLGLLMHHALRKLVDVDNMFLSIAFISDHRLAAGKLSHTSKMRVKSLNLNNVLMLG